MATPVRPHKMNLPQSSLSGNLKLRAAINQKKRVAPRTRNVMKLLGPIGSGITDFAMT